MFKAMKEMIKLPVPVEEVAAELGEDWEKIKDDPRLVMGYAESIATIRKVRRGEVPEGWTWIFECANCGPVFLSPGGPEKILGCPWCINMAEGLQIPRPDK
jgi:hypothetical protein